MQPARHYADIGTNFDLDDLDVVLTQIKYQGVLKCKLSHGTPAGFLWLSQVPWYVAWES